MIAILTTAGKRIILVIPGLLIGIVLMLMFYWTRQRILVTQVAQRGLDATYHADVRIDQIELPGPSPWLKWIVLPFRGHMWYVVYELPRMHGPARSTADVSLDNGGRWVLSVPPASR